MNKTKNIIQKIVDDLIPYARNARVHSKEQINRIASSIKEFGFINPVIIDKDGGIIAGHGRVEAAKKLNLKNVPCVLIEHLTETQKKAYILADNKLALDAEWDEEILKIELEELSIENFNVDLSGANFQEDTQMNEFIDEKEISYKEQYGVIVMCKDEEEQKKIYEELLKRGYECKVVAT